MEPTAEPPSRLGPPGSPRRRTLFFAISGALLVLVLYVFRSVLAPFALAVIVAFVLAPVVAALERIPFGARRMPRWVAVVIVYVLLLSGLGAAIAFGVPRVAAEVQVLVREAPQVLHTVQEQWVPRIEQTLREASSLYAPAEPEDVVGEAPATAHLAEPQSMRVVPHPQGGYEIHLPENGIEVSQHGEHAWRIEVAEGSRPQGGADLTTMIAQSFRRILTDSEAYTGGALRRLQTVIAAVVGGIFSFFIMLMLSAYMLITSDRIFGFFRALARPDRRRQFDELVARIDRGLAGVVRGQLLIALVNGVLSGIGFWLADLRYWPVLTLIATLLSIIPIFGAIISSIPAVVVALQNGFGTALFVLAWIIGIHQLEANLLNPKIMGDAAKVHPVLVVFALLAGEHFFGIAGALLAVPVLSITQSVFLHFREAALGVPRDAALAAQWAESSADRTSSPGEPPVDT